MIIGATISFKPIVLTDFFEANKQISNTEIIIQANNTKKTNKVNNIYVEKALSSSGRIELWLICWEIIKVNWFAGIGYGNFENVYLEYQARYFEEHGVFAFNDLTHPHNEYLLWFIEGGLLPLIGLCLYSVFILYRLYNAGMGSLPYVVMLLPISVHLMLELPFYLSTIHFILFISLLFLFEVNTSACSYIKIKYKLAIKSVTFVSLVLMSVFFVTNIQAIYFINKYYSTPLEKRTSEMLTDIVNPFAVQLNLNYINLVAIYSKALNDNNKELLIEAVKRAEEIKNERPRPVIYKDILKLYKLLGDITAYNSTLKKARYLYPLDEDFTKAEYY